MKIILSHDIDHYKWSDHWFKDFYIPKLWLRSLIQFIKGQISLKTAFHRGNVLGDQRIHRLDELATYLQSEGITSTFFIGYGNGLNLSYNRKTAAKIADKVKLLGFPIGVHGIAYNDASAMKQEFEHARSSLQTMTVKGLRMHYLRYEENITPILLKEVGYDFDSTEYKISDPYEILPGFYSFPIGVMETYAVKPEHQDLEQAKAYTLDRLQQAKDLGLHYFVINFHDAYFDDKGYGVYKDWLTWFISFLKKENHQFIDFQTALSELKHGN